MEAEHLDGLAVDRLIGPHIKGEDFTDDSLGRLLDEIANYNPTVFYTEVALKIISQLHIYPFNLKLLVLSFGNYH